MNNNRLQGLLMNLPNFDGCTHNHVIITELGDFQDYTYAKHLSLK